MRNRECLLPNLDLHASIMADLQHNDLELIQMEEELKEDPLDLAVSNDEPILPLSRVLCMTISSYDLYAVQIVPCLDRQQAGCRRRYRR